MTARLPAVERAGAPPRTVGDVMPRAGEARDAMDELCEALEAARTDGALVGIERLDLDATEELGFVVGVGSVLVALQRVSEAIHLDGVSILRLSDVTGFEDPHPQAGFIANALRLRGEVRGEPPKLDLSGWGGMLDVLAQSDELVAIHDEEDDESDGEGVCLIGRVLAVDGDVAHLLEIDPDAEWADTPSEISLATVTRVDFGGDYEAALRLVGGPPPGVGAPRP